MGQFKTPILFIVFNRLETTQKVFNVIKRIKPDFFYIVADGPRLNRSEDLTQCLEVKNYIIDNIDWDCEVKTLFREENLGCGYAPYTAITWFFSHVDEGIILEDDCLPDISFFPYCEELLEKFRDDNIAIISGCNFSHDKNQDSYLFSAIPYTWGWATWKKNWLQYDYEIKKWGSINKNEYLKYLFNDIEFRLFWKKIFDDIYKTPPNDIWDYQFFFSCFLQRQLSVVPSSNLVSNIGHGAHATHTFDIDSKQANVATDSLIFPLKHPIKKERNKVYDIYLQELCFGRIKYIPIRKRFSRLLKKVLSPLQFLS